MEFQPKKNSLSWGLISTFNTKVYKFKLEQSKEDKFAGR